MTHKQIVNLIKHITVEEVIDLPMLKETLEYHAIDLALAKAKGNRAYAASLLSLQRTTLIEKLRRRDKMREAGTWLG